MSKPKETNTYYSMGKVKNNLGKKTKEKIKREVERAKKQGLIIRHEGGRSVVKDR